VRVEEAFRWELKLAALEQALAAGENVFPSQQAPRIKH
jgi:hypothetical protein